VSKSQLQSAIATGAVAVAILTSLSIGRSDAQQVEMASLIMWFLITFSYLKKHVSGFAKSCAEEFSDST
jgi:hypothetical protein